jgi:ParB-like chromosome segregation protein Spo0J
MAQRFDAIALDRLDERYGSLKLVRPEIVAALRRSVEREGVLQAITVNARPGGKAILLDGFKRVMVLRELGRGEVQAKVVELSEEAALAAVIGCNRPHRGLTELEEAWVVRSLVRGCKLQQTDVAVLVGRHTSWVSRRLMLSERLDEDVAVDLRLGLLAPTVARELARLPRGNQAAVAASVRRHGLTSRQCAELVARCLASVDARATAELLAEPLRFLLSERASRPEAADPRLGLFGERLRRRMARLEGAAAAVSFELRQHPAGHFAPDEHRVLAERAQGTARSAEAALALLRTFEPVGGGGRP